MIISLLLLLSSCSLLIKSDQINSGDFNLKNKNEKLECDNKNTKKQTLTLNSSIVTGLNELNQALTKKNIKLSFIENAVIMALIEMNARPDSNSPTARLDVIYTDSKGYLYWDFFSEKFENEFSYLQGLEILLKFYKAPRTLLQLAELIDQFYTTPIIADQTFAAFLKRFNGNFVYSQKMKKAFHKGEDTLVAGEKINKINFKNLISNYQKNSKNSHFKSSNFLYEVSSILENSKNGVDATTLSCNLDLAEHKNSMIKQNLPTLASNTFGLIEKDKSIMFIASQLPNNFMGILDEFFIAGKTNLKTNSLCVLQNREKNRIISFVSFEDKDPSQHLYHLFKQSGDTLTEKENLTKALASSRYILLTNPTRLIFESRRGGEQVLNQLQHLKFPIYHSENLGVIWANYINPKSSENLFLIDDRVKTELFCE